MSVKVVSPRAIDHDLFERMLGEPALAFAGLLATSEHEAMDLEELRASWGQRLVDTSDRWPISGMTLTIREGVRIIGYSRFYPTEDHDDDPNEASSWVLQENRRA